MKGTLTRLSATTWDALRAESVERWLWVDTSGAGVHLEATLPEQPGQATHVWGWSGSWAIRARVDADLGGTAVVGVRAARFTWAGQAPASDRDPVDVKAVETTRPVWGVGNGRASMPAVPGLAERDRSLDLVTLDVVREVAEGARTTFVPLTFVRA